MALILVPCSFCSHSQMASEDVFWLELEIQCEECLKFFKADHEKLPLFISRIYNPSINSN